MPTIHRRRGWELPESAATPEHLVLNRRALGFAAGAALLGAPASLARAQGAAAPATDGAPSMAAMRNPRYRPERALTPEREATTYNNYYEFGSQKTISAAAARLRTRPWTVVLDGLVAKPQEIGFDDLLRRVSLEERVLRHRCVEAWAMTVPWTGFPMAELLRVAEPASAAKYVTFETAQQPDVMPGLRQTWYPWPYVEGCTVEEAANELAFVAVGLYGKPLAGASGAPLRVLFPWKYGFKAGKSVVRVTFTDRRPVSFWERIQPSEYGFWANVNPAVPHPRWSQATERLLGSNERVPTRIYNGYGEFVAALYEDKAGERLYV